MAFEYGEQKDSSGNITHAGSWGTGSTPKEAFEKVIENFRTLKDDGIMTTDWPKVLNKPTTLEGYGITDAAAASHTHSGNQIYTNSLDKNCDLGVATELRWQKYGNGHTIVDNSNSNYPGGDNAQIAWDHGYPVLMGYNGSQTYGVRVDSARTANVAGSAETAGIASTLHINGAPVAGVTFNWSGQAGQPSWLLGGNDGANIHVYNPANFNVNYANSAGNAATIGGYVPEKFMRAEAKPDDDDLNSFLAAHSWYIIDTGEYPMYNTPYGTLERGSAMVARITNVGNYAARMIQYFELIYPAYNTSIWFRARMNDTWYGWQQVATTDQLTPAITPGISDQSLNDWRPQGTYRGVHLGSSPNWNEWYWVREMNHDNMNVWRCQELTSYGEGGPPNLKYSRVCQNGVWTEWRQY